MFDVESPNMDEEIFVSEEKGECIEVVEEEKENNQAYVPVIEK